MEGTGFQMVDLSGNEHLVYKKNETNSNDLCNQMKYKNKKKR